MKNKSYSGRVFIQINALGFTLRVKGSRGSKILHKAALQLCNKTNAVGCVTDNDAVRGV